MDVNQNTQDVYSIDPHALQKIFSTINIKENINSLCKNIQEINSSFINSGIDDNFNYMINYRKNKRNLLVNDNKFQDDSYRYTKEKISYIHIENKKLASLISLLSSIKKEDYESNEDLRLLIINHPYAKLIDDESFLKLIQEISEFQHQKFLSKFKDNSTFSQHEEERLEENSLSLEELSI